METTSDSEASKGLSVEISNIVASGKLDVELDLAAVAEDLREQEGIIDVEHSRRQGNRLLVDFAEMESLGIVAPTGVYVFTGAKTHNDSTKARTILMEAFNEMGIIEGDEPQPEEVVDVYETKNVVCTGELADELNLDAVAIGLGLENTEYEPEQFPGLIYRPSSSSCTLLVFASGKVVVTGVTSEQKADEEFLKLEEKLDDVMGD